MGEAPMFLQEARFSQWIQEKNLLMLLAGEGKKEPFWNEKCQTTIFFLTNLPLGEISYLEPNLLGYYQSPTHLREGK